MAKNDRYRLNSNYGWKVQQYMRDQGYEWGKEGSNWRQILQQPVPPQPPQQPADTGPNLKFLDVGATPSGPRGSVTGPTYQPTYWEEPMKVAQWYTKWKADPTTQLPEGLDGKALEGIYKYMEYANGGKPFYGWDYLNEADPFRQYLTNLKPPAELTPGEQAAYGGPQPAQFANILAGHGPGRAEAHPGRPQLLRERADRPLRQHESAGDCE
jgi:hypothetical protein